MSLKLGINSRRNIIIDFIIVNLFEIGLMSFSFKGKGFARKSFCYCVQLKYRFGNFGE